MKVQKDNLSCKQSPMIMMMMAERHPKFIVCYTSQTDHILSAINVRPTVPYLCHCEQLVQIEIHAYVYTNKKKT